MKVFFLLILLFLNEVDFAQRYWNIAGRFNGTSYISVDPYYTLSNLSGSFTAECWFNCDSSFTGGVLFGKNGLRLMLDPYGNKVIGRVQTNNNTKLLTRSITAMDKGKWYHLACSYDSSTGLMNFYINGYVDTSITYTGYGPRSGTDSLLIGNSFPYYGSYKGLIDDIRIWNRPLTQSEILNNMRNPYVGPLNYSASNFGNGIVMSTSFDYPYTSGGIDFYDGFNSYYNHGVVAENLFEHPSRTLAINSALDLTNGGYVKMATNPEIEFNGPFTIEAWVYPTFSDEKDRYIIAKKGGWNDPGYAIYYDNLTGAPRVRFKINGSGFYSNSEVPMNKWTYISACISQDGASSKIYINGILDTEGQLSFPGPNTDSLYIGTMPNTNYGQGNFLGYVDAVRISNYEKNDQEIRNDMFKIIDFQNRPQPPHSTMSIDFDYSTYPSTDYGDFYYYTGKAKNSVVGLNNAVPISPLLGNTVQPFPDGFILKYSGKRIPETNSAGYMEDDSLDVQTSSPVSSLELFIALNHEKLSDLQIYLQSPSGDSVLVWNRNYGINYGVDQIVTVFNDDAQDELLNGTYVDFAPYVKPYASLNSAFSGKNPNGIWKLKITDLYNGGTGYLYGWGIRMNSATGIEEHDFHTQPEKFALEQNYPNPFNPTTTISYSVPLVSYVKLSIYDILGRKVSNLVDGIRSAGTYKILWDGKSDLRNSISSGVYFYRIELEALNGSSKFSKSMKMILLK